MRSPMWKHYRSGLRGFGHRIAKKHPSDQVCVLQGVELAFVAQSIRFHLETSIGLVRSAERRDRFALEKVLKQAQLATAALVEMKCRTPSPNAGTQRLLYRKLRDLNARYAQARTFVHFVSMQLLFELQKRLTASLPNGSAMTATIQALEEVFAFQGMHEAVACAYEAVLERDPAEAYHRMDAATKIAYRLRVESIADAIKRDPIDVAHGALALAESPKAGGLAVHVSRHVGFYLFRDTVTLKAHLCAADSASIPERLSMSLSTRAALYSLAFVAVCAAMAAGFAWYLGSAASGLHLLLIAALAAFVASDSAIGLLDQIGVHVQGPRHVHQLDYVTNGLPDDCLTAIVVPMLLQSNSNLDNVIALVERNFLMANDSNVVVVLLADFVDAMIQHPTTEESQLLNYAEAHIAALNARYPGHLPLKSFHVLARHREFVPADRQWRGYERKRGKLEAFTGLVTGASNVFFNLRPDEANLFSKVRYALCIDEDTKLTFDTVQHLVGVLDHPLNAPQVAEASGVPALVHGHVAVAPVIFACRADLSNHRWPHLIAQSSIDADSRSSTQYRSMLFDMYGVEINRGKVLYHLPSHATLSQARYPEGVLLSHDTIESAIMQPTFAGDAVVVESVPRSMLTACSRAHRWMRGDMQNALIYLFGMRRRSEISLYWKLVLLHQLRNQALPGVSLLLALAALAFAHNGQYKVLVIFWVAIALPSLCTVGGVMVGRVLQGQPSVWSRPNLWFQSLLRSLTLYASHLAYKVMCIPLMAFVACHASTTAALRLVTGKNLLKWSASSAAEETANEEQALLLSLGIISLLSMLAFGALLLQGLLRWPTGFMLALWALAPIFILQVRRRSI